MTVTKEQVQERAKELGIAVSETEAEQYVKDGKLPEKKELNSGTRVDELVAKYSHRQIAQMLIEVESESINRKHKIRKLEEDAEAVSKELGAVKEGLAKTPELEAKNKELQTTLQAHRDGEKKRREAALAKLSEEKRGVLDYLVNVDVVSPDKFDQTLALHLTTKGNGADAPPPGSQKESEVNPWKKETKNLTLQAKIVREDPTAAARLKQAAGVA